MQTTLESGAGDYSVGHEVRSNRLKDFVGCKVHFSYSTRQEPYTNGEPASEPNKTYHLDYFFNLGDIDPTNITFENGSGLHWGDGGLYEAPSVVIVRTRNGEKKITTRFLEQPEAESKLEDTSFIIELDSVDQDYAARFGRAFKHAVEACGGKPSLFADSHRQDSGEQTPATVRAAAQVTSHREGIPTIAKAATGAVVSIIMSDKDGNPIAQGSGFFVGKDGSIVTNYHVIAEGSSAIAKLPDGSVFPVEGVLAANKVRDVALIKARGDDFRTLPLGDSDRVQVGQEVVAIGNPLSLESTVSDGIISGMRSVKEEGGDFLQITAPISPGSSGGPLFNMEGQVVGITTMQLKGGENLNFAIPINDVKLLLRTDSAKVRGFPIEPETPALSPEMVDSTICITGVKTDTDGQIHPEVGPCRIVAPLPASISAGDHGINGKVCILSVAIGPHGQVHGIGPCFIVASLPFSFSKADFSILGGMETIDANAAETMRSPGPGQAALIAVLVRAFRDSRKQFCGRHPEMAIFNLVYVEGGPGLTETGPESCQDN